MGTVTQLKPVESEEIGHGGGDGDEYVMTCEECGCTWFTMVLADPEGEPGLYYIPTCVACEEQTEGFVEYYTCETDPPPAA